MNNGIGLPKNGSLLMTLTSSLDSMKRVERIIANAIIEQPQAVLDKTVAQFAKSIGVADSSIVRFCKTLGLDGYIQMKIKLAMELKEPEEMIFEDLKKNDDVKTIFTKIFTANIHTFEETLKGLDMVQIKRAVTMLCKTKKIVFYGVGSSAPLAMDAYYRFMRIGLPAYYETDPHISLVSANLLDKNCTAVGISHTGRTRSTLLTLEAAKKRGASIIVITSSLGSPIIKMADISLTAFSSESKYMKEAISARLGHIAILDALLVCVAMRFHDQSIVKMEELIDLLSEFRKD
jgi:DNA-binding MurR/RpiR family transcriptional regulator